MNSARSQDAAEAPRGFVREHEAKIEPIQIETNRAWWKANVTGKDEDFAAKEAAENRLNEALANPEPFARLKKIHEGKIDDKVLAREIDVLYLQYLEKQVDPALMKRMTAKATRSKRHSTSSGQRSAAKSLTDSEVRQILQKSKDSAERQAVWEASKRVGPTSKTTCRDLVRLRNEAATQARLRRLSRDAAALERAEASRRCCKLFDELDELTREPFARAKSGDRREAGQELLRSRRPRAAPVALSRSVLPGAAGRL